MKTISRRFLGTLLSATILASSSIATAYYEKPELTDISGHWAESSIQRWVNLDIVTGDASNKFNPNNNITRAEFATIVMKLFFPGYSKDDYNPYTDIKGDEWYARAIIECARNGIMSGSNGKANPTNYITRQEAMVILARCFAIEDGDTSYLNKFVDSAEVGSWAKGAISAMIEKGIISGVNGNRIAPNDYINRASVMKLLDNMIEEYLVTTDLSSHYTLTAKNSDKFIVINYSDKPAFGDTLTVTGKTSGVVINNVNAISTILDNLDAESVHAFSIPVSISGNTTIDNFVLNSTYYNVDIGENVKIDKMEMKNTGDFNGIEPLINKGTINELTINSVLKINNSGSIITANVNVNGVTINGNAPTNTNLSADVTLS